MLSAQRRELKSVLCSHGASNCRGNHRFVAGRQREFERNEFAQYQSFSDERPKTAFTKIARPSVQGKFLIAPLQTNPNPSLEDMTG